MTAKRKIKKHQLPTVAPYPVALKESIQNMIDEDAKIEVRKPRTCGLYAERLCTKCTYYVCLLNSDGTKNFTDESEICNNCRAIEIKEEVKAVV